MVKVKVLLFGPMAQVVQASEIMLQIDEPATCQQVLDALFSKHPELIEMATGARLAVNSSFAATDVCIHESDELALIAMVSGG